MKNILLKGGSLPPRCPRLRAFFALAVFFLGVFLNAQESPDAVPPPAPAGDAAAGSPDNALGGAVGEDSRLATIKYGTETEIASLIQTLKNEGSDYLDNELVALVEHSKNQKIVSSVFAFFSDREKKGL